MAKRPFPPLLVVRVNVEQTGFNIDAVDAQVYCINTTQNDLQVDTSSDSFITLDEETGDAAHDGSTDRFKLAPGEVRLISEIKGWEWDGAVGMTIVYQAADDVKATRRSYNFKSSSSDYKIESLNLEGRVISGK